VYLTEAHGQSSETSKWWARGLLSSVTFAVVFGRSHRCCQKTSVRSASVSIVNVSMRRASMWQGNASVKLVPTLILFRQRWDD